jgi:hypothetical protein
MFHDELIPAERREKHQDGYDRMADAVSESLRSYLWVVDQVYETYRTSGSDTHISPALLLLEYAEPIDGVSILARTGSAKNCVPLIRTGFELQLNIMYMLERDDTSENRCLAYELFHLIKQLKTARRADPESESGKQMRSQIKDESLTDVFDHPTLDVAAEITDIQKVVDGTRYAVVKSEYERSKAKHWYAMWDGPKSIEQLAGVLKMRGRYEVMYRYWSGLAHGESAMKRLTAEELQMDPIRSPKGLPIACLNACNLANEMASFLVGRFVPGLTNELKTRYLSHVKPGLEFIKSVQGL